MRPDQRRVVAMEWDRIGVWDASTGQLERRIAARDVTCLAISPDGKILIPGVISHSTPLVEHPELVAQRLLRFAGVVGRENLMGGSDCGFASFAATEQEIHPSIVWAKFASLAEGARIASKELW